MATDKRRPAIADQRYRHRGGSNTWRFAHQLTDDQHDAQDLAQRVRVRTPERIDQCKDSGTLKRWQLRITHSFRTNEVHSRTVRRHRDQRAINPDGLPKIETGHDSSTRETRLELQQVILAAETLPEGQRLAIHLCCVRGSSNKETADSRDIAVGTVAMGRLASIGKRFHDDKHMTRTRTPPMSGPIPSDNAVRQP